MAVSATLLSTPGVAVADKVYIEPDSTATAVDHITGAAGSELYYVEIDCTGNTGEDVYAKFYDSEAPEIGVTAAEVVLKGFKGKKTTYMFRQVETDACVTNTPAWFGWLFATGISFATTKEAGGGAGATAASGTVKVTLGIKD